MIKMTMKIIIKILIMILVWMMTMKMTLKKTISQNLIKRKPINYRMIRSILKIKMIRSHRSHK